MKSCRFLFVSLAIGLVMFAELASSQFTSAVLQLASSVLGSSAYGPLKFLVVPKTLTSSVIVTRTVTATVSTSTSCAALSNVNSACRRRRNAIEEAVVSHAMEYIKPSVAQSLETSIAPDARSVVSVDVQPVLDSSIESTPGLAEVHIRNLNSVCQNVEQQARVANPFFFPTTALANLFGITVLYSTTATWTAFTTSTVTVTKTNVFTFQYCTPVPFPYSTC